MDMKFEEKPSICIHNMANSKVVELSHQLQQYSDDQELIEHLLDTIQNLHNQLQDKYVSDVSREEHKDLQLDFLCLQIHLSQTEAERRRLEKELNCVRMSLNTLTSKHRESIAYLKQQVKSEKNQARKERELSQLKVKELEEELNAVTLMLRQGYDEGGQGGRMSCGSQVYSPAAETAHNIHTQCNIGWENKLNRIYRTSVHFDCMDHLRGVYLARGTKLSPDVHDVYQDGACAHGVRSSSLDNAEDNLFWRGLNCKERTLQPHNSGILEYESKSKYYKDYDKLPKSSQNVINSPDLLSMSSEDLITDSVPSVGKTSSSSFSYTSNAIYCPNIKANVVSPDNKTLQETLSYNIMKPAPCTPANYSNTGLSSLKSLPTPNTSESKCNMASESSLSTDCLPFAAVPTKIAHTPTVVSKSGQCPVSNSIDENGISEPVASSSNALKVLNWIQNNDVECTPISNGTYVSGESLALSKKEPGLNSANFSSSESGRLESTQTRKTYSRKYERSYCDSSEDSLPANKTGEVMSLANGKEASGPVSCGQYIKEVVDTQTRVNIICIGCGRVFLPNEHLLFLDHFEVCQKP